MAADQNAVSAVSRREFRILMRAAIFLRDDRALIDAPKDDRLVKECEGTRLADGNLPAPHLGDTQRGVPRCAQSGFIRNLGGS
jgi:hypothetical protein